MNSLTRAEVETLVKVLTLTTPQWIIDEFGVTDSALEDAARDWSNLPSLQRLNSLRHLHDLYSGRARSKQAEALYSLRKPVDGVIGKAVSEAHRRYAGEAPMARKMTDLVANFKDWVVNQSIPYASEFGGRIVISREVVLHFLHDAESFPVLRGPVPSWLIWVSRMLQDDRALTEISRAYTASVLGLELVSPTASHAAECHGSIVGSSVPFSACPRGCCPYHACTTVWRSNV